jgi:hypothetical protein
MRRIIGYVILFFCLTGIQAATQVVPLPDLIDPDAIKVDNRHIYITERGSINIYSKIDFKLAAKFGKMGEGPKEFKINPAGVARLKIDIRGDTILVNSMNRVTFFTTAGKYLEEFQVNSGAYFKILGNRYAGYTTSMENKIVYADVNLYDSAFKKLKQIFRKEYYVQANKKFDLVKLGCGNAQRVVYSVYDEKIFVEGEKNNIRVFNKEGKEEYVIKLSYDRLKVSEDHKKEIMDDLYTLFTGQTMRRLIKEKGYFPEFFSVRHFKAADNKIFIPTHRKRDGKNEFVILDLKGTIEKKIYLPFKDRTLLLPYPYEIQGGKLYQLFDNEETGEWELHILHSIDG